MRRVLCVIFLFAVVTAFADERGEKRMERISRRYSALGSYTLSFVLRAGGREQTGELSVEGNNSYMKLSDTEIFVEDSLRYEVRHASKEVIVDRADAYEKELLNSLDGFSAIKEKYDVKECEIDGRVALCLTAKGSGEEICIVTAVDGESISRIVYGVGDSMVVDVKMVQKGEKSTPRFSKERYNGFEMIDFR